MGSLKEFKCAGCGYKAEIAGGADGGLLVAVQTMSCDVCKLLFDAVVETYADRVKHEPRCHRCKGTNVSPWKENDRCPKCGGVMAAGVGTALWD